MKCINCGSENPDSSLYCSVCGSSLSQKSASETSVSSENSVPVQNGYTVPNSAPFPQYNSYTSMPFQPIRSGDRSKNWAAITGFVCSIAGTLLLCCYLLGVPVIIAGLVFSIIGLKSQQRGIAIAGTCISAVFLVFAILALTAILFAYSAEIHSDFGVSDFFDSIYV